MVTATKRLFSDQTAKKGKRERTRSALLDSAVSVFAAKGFEAASITDVTQQAGLANGTFYNYYRDKSELLHDVTTRLAGEIIRLIDLEMEGIDDASVRVVKGTVQMMKTARDAPDWLEVLLKSITVIPELRVSLGKNLQRDLVNGVEQGRFKAKPDELLLNQIISLISIGIVMDRDVSDETIGRTCEGILRLLGVPCHVAEACVSKNL